MLLEFLPWALCAFGLVTGALAVLLWGAAHCRVSELGTELLEERASRLAESIARHRRLARRYRTLERRAMSADLRTYYGRLREHFEAELEALIRRRGGLTR